MPFGIGFRGFRVWHWWWWRISFSHLNMPSTYALCSSSTSAGWGLPATFSSLHANNMRITVNHGIVLAHWINHITFTLPSCSIAPCK